MSIKFVAKVAYNDIYQIETVNHKNIKISITTIINSDNKELWKADIFIPQLGEWKYFLSDFAERYDSFDNFLEKLDVILRDD